MYSGTHGCLYNCGDVCTGECETHGKKIPVRYNDILVGYTDDEMLSIEFNESEEAKKVKKLLSTNQTVWVSSRKLGEVLDDKSIIEKEIVSYDISHFGSDNDNDK